MNILDYKKTLVAVGTVSASVSAACVGYLFATKEWEDRFNDDLDTLLKAEVHKVRMYYALMHKDTEPADHSDIPDGVVVDQQHISIPKEALATAEGRAEVMEKLAEAIEPDEPEVSLVEHSVFEQDEDLISFEAIMAERSADQPYVISKEEFIRNDSNHDVQLLVFFEKDGTLMDSEDDIIPDSETIVGDRNLQRFGVMSQNNNVVYVQNDVIETVFQITRNGSMTATEALYGIDEDDDDAVIQHSSMKRRRPRREDE